MRKKVIQIAEKYLREGYDDHQTEIMYQGPWNVLCMYDTDEKIREFATEVVTVIRGIDQTDLIIRPTLEEMTRMVLDIMPGEYSDPNEEGMLDNASYHAQYLLKKLNSVYTPKIWRGKKIKEGVK